jgi:chemotaxis methyl-accepting protein methylase
MKHQNDITTKLNRYPEIFNFCNENKPKNNCKILSFGSSTGEELVSLAMHFGESEIHGVEINTECTDQSKIITKNVDRIKVSQCIPDEKFDIIFCMSVLCRWPETQTINDCSHIYKFEQFEDAVNEIDKHLNENGLLIIFNSSFIFEDVEISKKYESIFSSNDAQVHKFSKENKKINTNYKKCVFRKSITIV